MILHIHLISVPAGLYRMYTYTHTLPLRVKWEYVITSEISRSIHTQSRTQAKIKCLHPLQTGWRHYDTVINNGEGEKENVKTDK